MLAVAPTAPPPIDPGMPTLTLVAAAATDCSASRSEAFHIAARGGATGANPATPSDTDGVPTPALLAAMASDCSASHGEALDAATAVAPTAPLQTRPLPCRRAPERYDGQLHGLDSGETLDATLPRCVAPPPPPPPHQWRADAPPMAATVTNFPARRGETRAAAASGPIRRRPIGDAPQTSTLSLAPHGDSRSTKAATNARPWESAPPARPRLRPTKVLPRAARLSGGRVGEPTAALRQSAIRTAERRNDNFRFQLFPIPLYNVRWCSACAAPLRRSSWLSRLRRHRIRTSSVDRVLRYRVKLSL